MDHIIETRESTRNTFFNHVFSTTEDGKAEILNTVQYAVLAIIPLISLNKIIQRFIPEASDEKSSIEVIIEILIQVIIIFIGLILVHRIITYVPTYSGFKYSELILTSSVLTFLLIVLTIQTKLGLKVNILWERLLAMWNGESSNEESRQQRRSRQSSGAVPNGGRHVPSQADFMDDGLGRGGGGGGGFPPMPQSSSAASQSFAPMPMDNSPRPASEVLGGSFGSFF